MDLKNICFHGTLEWRDSNKDSKKTSAEYFEGSYPQVYCNIQGIVCPFKNSYQECELRAKKERE